MAGMGPVPKHVAARRRTNATPPSTKLPMEGYRGAVPDFPLNDPTWQEIERWNVVWRSPMAAMWARMDIALVVARYVRDCVLVESGHTTAAIAHLRAAGPRPAAPRALSRPALPGLRWEIAADEVDEAREASTASSPRRRLKAVDPTAAEG